MLKSNETRWARRYKSGKLSSRFLCVDFDSRSGWAYVLTFRVLSFTRSSL